MNRIERLARILLGVQKVRKAMETTIGTPRMYDIGTQVGALRIAEQELTVAIAEEPEEE